MKNYNYQKRVYTTTEIKKLLGIKTQEIIDVKYQNDELTIMLSDAPTTQTKEFMKLGYAK